MKAATQRCHTPGTQLSVGPYLVRAGGWRIPPDIVEQTDVLVMLGERIPEMPIELGPRLVLRVPLVDFGGVPDNWKEVLTEHVVPLLETQRRLTFFCHAGHGRTGTILASLVALLEPRVVDPIATVRMRYCRYAIETLEQATAVFALRGQPVPKRYQREFANTLTWRGE